MWSEILRKCHLVAFFLSLALGLGNLIFNRTKFPNVYAKAVFFFVVIGIIARSTQPTPPHTYFSHWWKKIFQFENRFSSLAADRNPNMRCALRIYVGERADEYSGRALTRFSFPFRWKVFLFLGKTISFGKLGQVWMKTKWKSRSAMFMLAWGRRRFGKTVFSRFSRPANRNGLWIRKLISSRRHDIPSRPSAIALETKENAARGEKQKL